MPESQPKKEETISFPRPLSARSLKTRELPGTRAAEGELDRNNFTDVKFVPLPDHKESKTDLRID
jgi:hypothetical protein